MKECAGRTPGTVYLVGAGPGDPDLITLRGLKLLRQAEVVLYDRLAPAELLAEAAEEAELIGVGKRGGWPSVSQEQINSLMVEKALQGKCVVRLKGGDPFVFGRGGEEQEICRRAGVPCQVVPGVSSSLAGPASAGIPVTHREMSRHFVVVTASTNGRGADLDYAALAAIDTIVVLMGRRRLAEVCAGLIEAGRDALTPAACIERATTSRQKTVLATLSTLAGKADLQGLQAPAIIVIGETASLASQTPFADLLLNGPQELRESA